MTQIADRWVQYEDGKTVGQRGSENGIVMRDEEYPGCARITLERNSITAPFAITCGLYGWVVHTRFISTEDNAQEAFREMGTELDRIVDLVPDDANFDRLESTVTNAIRDFVERFQ